MNKENRVLSGVTAIVNGEKTALTGCLNPFCLRECLRKDPKLLSRESFVSTGCKAFIAVTTE